jgi:biotin carboxylase
MKRLLVIASTTGYQVRVLADAARRLGVEPVLATDRCHKMDDPWADQAIPVRFHKLKYSAHLIAMAQYERGVFDGVVAMGDKPARLAAFAAAKLGLPWSSPASLEACSNKYLARERFRAAGLPVPGYVRIPLAEDPARAAAGAKYPCVLKPLGLSGSRGVIRADTPEQFVAAFHRVADILRNPEIARTREEQDCYLQVESYIPGTEYALEGILTRGRLKTLALFDKPDPLDGPFFEETIYVTPSRAPASVQSQLIEAAERAVEALGLTHGPIHAEFRHNSSGAWPLEVAARPIGGLCSRCLRFGSGMPLEELIIRHALGEDIAAVERESQAAGVMMIPIPREGIYRGVEGTEDAAAAPGIEGVEITAKEGQALIPLPEGASYLGFIFGRGGTASEVEQALRGAHALLRFEITPTLPVFRYALDRGGR